jgi:O-acetyl-ADP-ribose deacetylase (regulator of RNase III)
MLQDMPEQDILLHAEEALRPTFAGSLGQVDLPPFGSLEVQHGDIFNADSEAVILPMLPNLMPYRGLSLEVFDRGGKDLVKETFRNAKDAFINRTPTSDQRPHVGDTIVVEGRGVRAKNIIFVILPWFWQGSSMDATKRLRFCVRRALDMAGSPQGFSSVALPSLGAGVHGYEPRRSSNIFLEEAIEVLLQIDKQMPSYKLKHITFMDSRRETAEGLSHALTEVAHRWLPERRITSAPEYWGNATRRLVLLPSRPGVFYRRHRVKFKKHHGVVRRMRHNYLGNIRSKLWRAHRVHQPPPLLVFKESGEAVPRERQLRARPYYFRGVSHWLFPVRRTGFHALRKGAKGQWVALNQQYRLREDFRPRL